ncbi:hypothetical protein FUAX_34240 [Fulvitalea axinellae]|uniref:Uncharacterized protein n=1 Tax=Fulvitalea axinellae TaxID=1182444 RepID=A0AAU9CSJ9_9BACT|nr:hypothetical protein FUAX_34240 [Fulvitalea axinellae]
MAVRPELKFDPTALKSPNSLQSDSGDFLTVRGAKFFNAHSSRPGNVFALMFLKSDDQIKDIFTALYLILNDAKDASDFA